MKKILILLMLFSINCIAAPVNINTADAETIAESLKGIGQKKAEAIVKYRNKNGSFKSLDDLRNVKGLGEKTLQNIATDIGFSKSKKGKTSKAKKTVKVSEKKSAKKSTTKSDKKSEKKKVEKKNEKKSKKKDKKKDKKSKKKKSSDK